MYKKLKISGTIQVLTGLHIGGSSSFAVIGTVDSPVVRDVRTQLPIIPGSSLKGKMRTLLARAKAKTIQDMGQGYDNDPDEILRLFGKSAKRDSDEQEERSKLSVSRLQFADCFLENADALLEYGVTEVKTENAIARLSSEANPRPIERVVRGAEFSFNCIYDLYTDGEQIDEKNLEKDFDNIALGLSLLQLDYLGGHGTRGYGRIHFKNLTVEELSFGNNTTGQMKKELLDLLKAKLQQVVKGQCSASLLDEDVKAPC